MPETLSVTFRGWPSEALEFYEGLSADNSKTYWTAHLSVYETQVRGPMDELLAALEPEFGSGKIFRPYRDVRFSKDKSPYKTHLGAWLEAGGYLQLSADGLAAGCGMYQLAPDQLDRYRRAVADDRTGGELTDLIAHDRGGRDRGARARQPQDRPEGLSEGPSATGPAAPQGPHHVAGLAAAGLAGHGGRQDPDRRLPPHEPPAAAVARRQRRTPALTHDVVSASHGVSDGSLTAAPG